MACGTFYTFQIKACPALVDSANENAIALHIPYRDGRAVDIDLVIISHTENIVYSISVWCKGRGQVVEQAGVAIRCMSNRLAGAGGAGGEVFGRCGSVFLAPNNGKGQQDADREDKCLLHTNKIKL